jgi:hypothetical protein
MKKKLLAKNQIEEKYEKYQRPPLAKSKEPKLEPKKSTDFKFGIEEKEIEGFGTSFTITMFGEKASIRSGLIKAMVTDEVFANYIILAAEYFKTIKK